MNYLRKNLKAVSLSYRFLHLLRYQTMGKVSVSMKQMNKINDPLKMQQRMLDYQRATQGMALNEEMMDDALSSAFDDDLDEEEADELVRQTLEQVGIDAASALGSAPTHKVRTTADEEDEETDRIMKQLLGSS